MSEHPHLALVRRGYAAFSAGDMDTLREIIAPDAVHKVGGDNAIAGDHKGIDAILTHYGRLAELTDGTLRVHLENLFTDGDGSVVAVHHVSANRGGQSFDALESIVFEIVNDKAVSLTQCEDDLDKFNQFWA